MRSEDIAAKKEPGHVRVFFIGNSVTYGTTYIDQSLIFTSLVGSELPKLTGYPAEVLNASAGGWAASNEVGFLTSKGTFDADLVLIVLNSGDLQQPFNDYSESPSAPTEQPVSAIGEAWNRYLLPRLYGTAGASPDPGQVLAQQEVEFDAILSTLGKGRGYALAHGSRFGIVYIPSGKVPEPLYKRKKLLCDWAAANEVPIVDLTSVFERYPIEELYLHDGGYIHLDVPGHKIVASSLLDALPVLLNSHGRGLN